MFSKKFLSLDIGNKNIKIVTGKYQKNKVYIDNAIITETPISSVEDGNITDKMRLAEILKTTIGINSIKVKDTNCTTSSNSIITREITIPKDKDADLKTVVEFEVQQYLPIILEDYIIQYSILEELEESSMESSIERLRLMVVAYPKYMAEAYLSLLEEAELKAENLDVNFNSINKLFKDDVNINGEKLSVKESTASINLSGYNINSVNKDSINNTIAVVDMGAERININIYTKGKIDFNRAISQGGNNIDRHIAGKYDIGLEESEKRKRQYCDLLGVNEEFSNLEINDVIREDVDKWIEEMIKIIQFYRNKNLGNNIDKIYIYGGSSRIKGLEEYMTNALNIPVVKINSMSNLVFAKDVDKEDLDYYLNAIGAIIRL